MVNKPATWWQWLGLGAGYILLPVLALWALYWIDQPAQPPHSTAVDPSRVEMTLSHSYAPPQTDWRPLAGAKMRGVEMQPFTSVWFRFPAQPLDDSALYIPEPRGNVALFVNDQQVFLAAPVQQPLAFFRSPLLITLPSLAEGDVLYLHLMRQPDNVFPPYVFHGPESELLEPFNDRLFTHRWLPLILVAMMLPLMMILGGVYLFGRRESAYGWYALTLLLWGAHTAHGVIDHVPFHHNTWFVLNYLMLTWVVAEIVFINRFFDFKSPGVERGLLMITVLMASVFLSVGWFGKASHMSTFAMYVFTPWTMLCALYVSGLYFAALFTRWSSESLSLWLASSIFTVAAIRDWLYEFGAAFIAIPGSTYYLQFVVLLPLVFFGALLVRRHVAALSSAERLNTELEDRVAEKAQQLETSYQELTAEQQRRTLAEERARLMRDMHDGLGGQLVHALGLSEQNEDPELKSALRFALEDLRLIIDSLAPEESTLSALLASYRHRTTKVVQRQGIDLRWDLAQLTHDFVLSPQRALGAMRIVQEAVTNSVRHSHCTTIIVSASHSERQITLCVADDGRGIGDRPRGRGLSNMEARATEIGAHLGIDTNARGTRISIEIPQ